MYIEYIYPIEHYFRVIQRNEAGFDIGLPLVITILGSIILYFFNGTISQSNTEELLKTIITLLAILVGFTITSIAILTSTSGNINKETDRLLGNKKVTLHQLLNIFFIFALFSEIITLIVNLSALVLIFYNMKLVINHLNVLVVINILLISHILFINIRNVTNFYFILHNVKS